MIFEGIPFSRYFGSNGPGTQNKAIEAFIEFLENRFGARFLYDARNIPFGRADLIEPLHVAAVLETNGIINKFGQTVLYPDEPQTKSWYALCNTPMNQQVGGSTFEDDSAALMATLAESLERYIWYMEEDYFRNPRRATIDGIRKFGPFVSPEEIAGFSREQRAERPERQLHKDAEYLWIKGRSLVRGSTVYVPAQVISCARFKKNPVNEPLIRQQTTNGLATWPTQAGARLAGALELIEREAYMIMWLNQLSLPRISPEQLCSDEPKLARSFAICERYRLKVHVIKLLTDAPTHAIAVVLEDMSGTAPRFAVGLKAHRSLSVAVQKAMTEALRARNGYRAWADAGNIWDEQFPPRSIGHRERSYYWGVPKFAKKLEFMTQGPEVELVHPEWEKDTEEEHLLRILRWCKEKQFECVAVSLGTSAKNPTPLHIEMVLIPQLQPTYLAEGLQAFGGTRWHDVPKAHGYAPLKKPFADAPHPFS